MAGRCRDSLCLSVDSKNLRLERLQKDLAPLAQISPTVLEFIKCLRATKALGAICRLNPAGNEQKSVGESVNELPEWKHKYLY